MDIFILRAAGYVSWQQVVPEGGGGGATQTASLFRTLEFAGRRE